jgi:CubicO group peptidase (beta-lactamase class C family)
MKLSLVFLSLQVMYVTNLGALLDGQKIDTYLKSFKNFSGAVLIAQNNNVILKKGYGYASYEFEVPNTPQTKFPIASNTKLFTALAIMQLQEQNLLNVQDTLNKYIPDFSHGDKVTLHHLLTHTSGIQNYYKQWPAICNCKNLEEMVTTIKTWPLEFEPGMSYSYSNSGYTLLAYIIEKVSGITYKDFISQYIFKPLHMYDSGSEAPETVVKNRACRYIAKNNTISRAPLVNNVVTLIGNGDLYSSLDDLYKFSQALYTEKILSKQSLNMVFEPHVQMENSLTRAHGYGCFIDKKCNKRIIEYSGALVGFLSTIMRFIDDNITLIVLTNVENQEHFCKIRDDLSTLSQNSDR